MARFPTTRWSAVLEARSDEPERRRQAWDVLIAAYYRPAYAHLRVRWKRSPENAEDLTQAFFERAIEKDFFLTYERDKTRFRTFVRLCLDRFVQNADKADGRLKRGGGAIALDFDGIEEALQASSESPDTIFDREWSRCLVALSVEALRHRCEESEKRGHYQLFERYDLCPPEERPTYAELASELGLPVTTVTNQLASVRREFRAVVFDKLRELTADDEEFRSEAQRLLGVEPR